MGKRVRTTWTYWLVKIYAGHAEIRGREADVQLTLRDPDEIRMSRRDSEVYLYYKRFSRLFVCVVARHLNGEGYVVTAYVTDVVKEGRQTWKK